MSQTNHTKYRRLHSLDFRLKLTEVSLVSVCLGLGLDAFANGTVPQWPGVGCCCILTGAYVIITGVTIGCTIFAQPLPRSVGVAFSVVGGVLLAAVAVAVLRAWRSAAAGPPPAAGRTSWMTGLHQMRLLGLLSLAAAAAFVVDAAHAAIVGPWLIQEHEAMRQAMAAASASASSAASETASETASGVAMEPTSAHETRASHSANVSRVWDPVWVSLPRQMRGESATGARRSRVGSADGAAGDVARGAARGAGTVGSLGPVQSAFQRPCSVASSVGSVRADGALHVPSRRSSALPPITGQRRPIASASFVTNSHASRLRRPSTSSGLGDSWKPSYIGGQTIDEGRYSDYRRELF